MLFVAGGFSRSALQQRILPQPECEFSRPLTHAPSFGYNTPTSRSPRLLPTGSYPLLMPMPLKFPPAFVALAMLLVALPGFAPAPALAQSAPCQTFSETGKTICGRFLPYWQEHGGLAQQGYPISVEMQERSQTDGKTYTVQYFERAVFELHPENATPNDVLLSLLGNFFYKEKYPGGAPGQKASTDNPRLFKETSKTLGGKFRVYWEKNGGLAQQGYPISDEFQERAADGKTYTVQYFERAVFELHPENAAPYDVLLSRLGAEQYARTRPASGPTPTAPPSGGDVWVTLRARPLKLPAVANGGACPVTPAKSANPDFGLALGDGPVYPAGFGADSTFHLSSTFEEGGWYYIKVLWIAAPAYRGPVLLRGARIDAPGDLRFDRGTTPAAELQLAPEEGLAGGPQSQDWLNWPSYTRVRTPGCYAYQIDGSSFSRTAVFKVDN